MRWSSHYHNLLWVFLILCAGSFALLPGSSEEAYAVVESSVSEGPTGKPELKHGRFESHDANGKLKSVVNYAHGKKQGTSYLYYPTGKVHLEMTYENNLRQGTSKKYYKTGELYAVTPYVDNKIEGLRETYYESGKIRAAIPYQNSWPGKGLKEYTSGGKERTLNTGLQIDREGSVWYFEAAEPCRQAKYYLGQLVDGEFLDVRRVKLLQASGDGAILDTSGKEGLERMEVICKCTTMQNNPLILSTRL